jgi:hypothetical protein
MYLSSIPIDPIEEKKNRIVVIGSHCVKERNSCPGHKQNGKCEKVIIY